MTIVLCAPKHSLTPKEIEVMKRIADGYSTKEIAFALKVSTKTVETHRTRTMEKLGCTESLNGRSPPSDWV